MVEIIEQQEGVFGQLVISKEVMNGSEVNGKRNNDHHHEICVPDTSSYRDRLFLLFI